MKFSSFLSFIRLYLCLLIFAFTYILYISIIYFAALSTVDLIETFNMFDHMSDGYILYASDEVGGQKNGNFLSSYTQIKGWMLGHPEIDYVTDSGDTVSNNPQEWWIKPNHQYSNYFSKARSEDANEMAKFFDYQCKVNGFKTVSTNFSDTLFKDNPSAAAWFSDYTLSYGDRKLNYFNNDKEFRDGLRQLTFYRKNDVIYSRVK